MSKTDGLEKYLSRRIITEEGMSYFCRICGTYKPEDHFYRRKDSKWGVDYKCKIHSSKRDVEHDPDMDYLKLDPLTEEDFIQSSILLQKLGYDITKNIHEQFLDRYENFKKASEQRNARRSSSKM